MGVTVSEKLSMTRSPQFCLWVVEIEGMVRGAFGTVAPREEVRQSVQRLLTGFPGRCPVCSFHRVIIKSGKDAALPAVHLCPEGVHV